MKKALRVIVPVLLAIAVLGSAMWYIFVYDRDFTRDLLLQQARNFEGRGNHTIAQWLYNTAYAHADNDETVAIELADQYKASGNYTKAEYTLSKAIADGGSANLYMELCKTYVEQDKLLDAVNMLDKIADPAIKAELDAMRPAAPVTTPDPGFYSQYISVELTSNSGILYASIDGQYPSTEDDPYTQPIALNQGETTVYALSVADNGLVSPLSIYGYTIGGVIEPVTFADPAVEAAVRSTLGVDEGKTLYTNELWNITAFTMPGEAQTYADLKHLSYLQSLTIEEAIASELNHISNLGQLTELTITGSSPSDSDMQIIGTLPLLQKLTLTDCSLSTVEHLASAHDLVYLNLNDNTIRNLSPLSELVNLQELNLGHNALTDLSALNNLNNLTKLDVSYNSLTSIAPICTLKNLTHLFAGYNSISDISAIGNLSSLRTLHLAGNMLADISPAAACTALTDLDISYNLLTDISSLGGLNTLQALSFNNNQITSLPTWEVGCALIRINGENNLLTDLEPLRGLENLNYVYMSYNKEITSIACLAECPKLVEVSAWDTQVTEEDARALLDQSIIVDFDPTLGKSFG